MIISDTHLKAIEYIIEGKSMTDIAKICGIGRATLYNWLDNKEFKAELDKQRQDIKTNIETKVVSKLGVYLDELHRIATTSKNDKERRSACEYLVDRALGKSTTKVADVTEESNKNSVEDIDDMIEKISKGIA
ncbi:IS630 transposase-related protein [Clostridium sp.]|uniref:IS630 transposase-related protein n=1 Tax=Clostridium sp. TaxID=1506 RepID=UPI003216C445